MTKSVCMQERERQSYQCVNLGNYRLNTLAEQESVILTCSLFSLLLVNGKFCKTVSICSDTELHHIQGKYRWYIMCVFE